MGMGDSAHPKLCWLLFDRRAAASFTRTMQQYAPWQCYRLGDSRQGILPLVPAVNPS